MATVSIELPPVEAENTVEVVDANRNPHRTGGPDHVQAGRPFSKEDN